MSECKRLTASAIRRTWSSPPRLAGGAQTAPPRRDDSATALAHGTWLRKSRAGEANEKRYYRDFHTNQHLASQFIGRVGGGVLSPKQSRPRPMDGMVVAHATFARSARPSCPFCAARRCSSLLVAARRCPSLLVAGRCWFFGGSAFCVCVCFLFFCFCFFFPFFWLCSATPGPITTTLSLSLSPSLSLFVALSLFIPATATTPRVALKKKKERKRKGRRNGSRQRTRMSGGRQQHRQTCGERRSGPLLCHWDRCSFQCSS